jgi:uncharacterized protein (UPF0335 family)
VTTDSAKKAAAYVKRMENLMRQVTELQADIKDICTEAKAAGFSAPLLRRWAAAMAKDKAGALALQTMELHTIGETLVPDLFGVREKPDDGDEGIKRDAGAAAKPGKGGRPPRTPATSAPPTQAHDADGVIIESADETSADDGSGSAARTAIATPSGDVPRTGTGSASKSPDAPLSGARIAPSIPTGDAAGASGHGIDGESPEDAADAEAAGMSRLASAPRPAVGMSAPAASISAGEIDIGIPAFLDKRRRL